MYSAGECRRLFTTHNTVLLYDIQNIILLCMRMRVCIWYVLVLNILIIFKHARRLRMGHVVRTKTCGAYANAYYLAYAGSKPGHFILLCTRKSKGFVSRTKARHVIYIINNIIINFIYIITCILAPEQVPPEQNDVHGWHFRKPL
jgi:hypothetical protein